jgi:pyruvate dehydrogenase E1 component alpha subunit
MEKKYDRTIAKELIKNRLSQMIINEDYKSGKFKIPIHLAFGHESIAVAVNNVINKDDKLILTHRNIAYNLARLGKLRPIRDEYLLRKEGLMKGKTGSMNLINPEKGVIYSSSILGNNFSVGVGVAMAQKIYSKNGITIILSGDGSIEEGSFYESLIMLKTYNLPAILIVENNEWSMATKISERRCQIELENITKSLGIKYEKIKSNNPYELISKLNEVKEYSLKNNEPVCIEIMLTTLGDWRKITPEFPEGKFINYHAGPAPTIDIKTCPIIIKESERDPIFVISDLIGKNEFEQITKEIRDELEKELE